MTRSAEAPSLPPRSVQSSGDESTVNTRTARALRLLGTKADRAGRRSRPTLQPWAVTSTVTAVSYPWLLLTQYSRPLSGGGRAPRPGEDA